MRNVRQRREAFEEVRAGSLCDCSVSMLISCSQIGLSLNKQKVPLLCILEPFLAGNQLLVTPYAQLCNISVVSADFRVG